LYYPKTSKNYLSIINNIRARVDREDLWELGIIISSVAKLLLSELLLYDTHPRLILYCGEQTNAVKVIFNVKDSITLSPIATWLVGPITAT